MKKVIIPLVVATISLFFVAGCSSQQTAPSTKTFVLVHGAWQAPFVWQAVKDELEKKKQQVIVV